MSERTVLVVSHELSIPRAELEIRATRAGGPGGQHVNTASTRIELLWDLAHSAAVDDSLRERLQAKLGGRLDAEGRVRIVASEHRSQQQNRLAAEKRLAEVVRKAMVVPKKRRPTKPTRASQERRISEKKRRSQLKQDRRGNQSD